MRVREVCNVDTFQGFESDIVFLSTVRCNTTGKSGFVDDPRRLNVAMTRAKRALIVFGNRSTLLAADSFGTWKPFFRHFEAKGWMTGSQTEMSV